MFEFVTVTNLSIERVSTPLFIRLGNRARKHTDDAPNPSMGTMRHIVISNVIGRGTSTIPSSITGLPDACVEDVSLSDIRIISAGGGAVEDARVQVPEKADGYPESAMFGTLPASGLYVRHVKGLALDNVQLVLDGPDERSTVVMEDVDGLDIDDFRGSAPSGNEAVMRLENTRHALVRGCRGLGDMKLFLKVEGPESGDITLGDNALDRMEKVIELGEGVAKTSVRVR